MSRRNGDRARYHITQRRRRVRRQQLRELRKAATQAAQTAAGHSTPERTE
ncbi:MAG: hypothetical protein AB7F99_08310 [Vicinamibacterales bacterium]